ncbi:hypothetical protein WMY93_026346 [Mugilogobius chulae]|uniref:Uncharacterized protein n=1 Tax=Mugilogobius chulae TaxID=88201 RepID=A0AAW0N1I7_9GOBI
MDEQTMQPCGGVVGWSNCRHTAPGSTGLYKRALVRQKNDTHLKNADRHTPAMAKHLKMVPLLLLLLLTLSSMADACNYPRVAIKKVLVKGSERDSNVMAYDDGGLTSSVRTGTADGIIPRRFQKGTKELKFKISKKKGECKTTKVTVAGKQSCKFGDYTIHFEIFCKRIR